jgi:hypothetical protein
VFCFMIFIPSPNIQSVQKNAQQFGIASGRSVDAGMSVVGSRLLRFCSKSNPPP